MKRIKLFEQYIREFVENSEISYDDLKKCRESVIELVQTIENEFLLDSDLDMEEVLETYDKLLDISVFKELNNIINTYYNDSINLYFNLDRLIHLLKEMLEQYNNSNVKYTPKEIDSSIDSFVNSLNSILPFAIKKISNKEDKIVDADVKVLESIKNRKK